MSQQQLAKLIRRLVASTYSNPEQWFLDAIGAGKSDAGIAVTHETSLTYATVWACVDIVSSDAASLPLNDTLIDANGDRDVNRRSQVQWLLNHEPNELMTAFSFRRTLQSHAMLAGNGYAAISRDGTGRPMRLIPVHPSKVRVYYDDDGRLWYDVQGFPDPISGMDMIHIAGLGSDGVCGYSVISKARNSWGLGMAAEQHGSSHFKNGASPKIALKTPEMLSEDDANALLAMWGDKHEGSENAGRTALAAGGLEIEALPISNEDAQWIESRRFQREEVAAWFGVPVHMVGGEKGPYNSTIAENQAYLRRTLKKWLCAWEQECERKLFADRVRRSGTRRLIHDTTELLSADPETQANIEALLVQAELSTRNEGRRRLGRNHHDDPIADRLSSPNTRTDNVSDDSDTDDDPIMEARVAHRQLVAERMQKLVDTERKNVERGCNTRDFLGWLDTFYDQFSNQLRDALQPFVAAYNTIPGAQASSTADEIAVEHVKTSKAQLLEVAGVCGHDTLKEAVAELTSQWEGRATTTATALIGA